MPDPLSHAVRGYSALASELGARWSAHASKVAAKLDAGKYDVDDAVADLAATALLVGDSWFLLGNEALEAAAILSGRQDQPHVIVSRPYTAPRGAKLELTGPLTNGWADTLPVGVVGIQPSQLAADKTEFSLRAVVTGRPPGTYLGGVRATPAAGQPELIRVLIAVP